MSYLVGDMLLLASADAGHWVIRMAPLDMDTLLIDMYERFEPLYQDKGVALETAVQSMTTRPMNSNARIVLPTNSLDKFFIFSASCYSFVYFIINPCILLSLMI